MPVFFWSLILNSVHLQSISWGLWAESRGGRPPFCPLGSGFSFLPLLAVVNPNRHRPILVLFQWSRGEFLHMGAWCMGFNSALRALWQKRSTSLCGQMKSFCFWWQLCIFWIVFLLNATWSLEQGEQSLSVRPLPHCLPWRQRPWAAFLVFMFLHCWGSGGR